MWKQQPDRVAICTPVGNMRSYIDSVIDNMHFNPVFLLNILYFKQTNYPEWKIRVL